MALHVFLYLLLSSFMLCLARLCHLYLLHHCFPHLRIAAVHTTVQRVLKPRTPLDCPACRLPPPSRLWNQRLYMCLPGARSKVGGEHRNA